MRRRYVVIAITVSLLVPSPLAAQDTGETVPTAPSGDTLGATGFFDYTP